MYAMRAAVSGSTSVPGRRTSASAPAAIRLSSAAAYGASPRSRAATSVASSRKSAKGIHQTTPSKRTRVRVRPVSWSPATASAQPMGTITFTASPIAMYGNALCNRRAEYQKPIASRRSTKPRTRSQVSYPVCVTWKRSMIVDGKNSAQTPNTRSTTAASLNKKR